MRKLCLTLAAGLAVLSTAALPSRAVAMPTVHRPAFEGSVQPVRWVCFWGGYRQVCSWVPNYWHHYGRYRNYGQDGYYRNYGQDGYYRHYRYNYSY